MINIVCAYLLWVEILLWTLDSCDLGCGCNAAGGCWCCTFAVCMEYEVLVWFFGCIVVGFDIALIAVLVIVLTTLALPCLIVAAELIEPPTPPIVWFTNLIACCCWLAFVLFTLFTFMLLALLIAIALDFWIWITFPIWFVWCCAIGVVVRVIVVGCQPKSGKKETWMWENHSFNIFEWKFDPIHWIHLPPFYFAYDRLTLEYFGVSLFVLLHWHYLNASL